MKSKKIYTCFDTLASIASQVVVTYFVSIIIKRVCQEGGKIMTNAQVAYLEHLERKRANLVGEAETHRSNVARETETKRHNEISEAIDTGGLQVKKAEAGIKGADVAGKHILPLIGNAANAVRNIGRALKRKKSVAALNKVLDRTRKSGSAILPMNTAVAKRVVEDSKSSTHIMKGE